MTGNALVVLVGLVLSLVAPLSVQMTLMTDPMPSGDFDFADAPALAAGESPGAEPASAGKRQLSDQRRQAHLVFVGSKSRLHLSRSDCLLGLLAQVACLEPGHKPRVPDDAYP